MDRYFFSTKESRKKNFGLFFSGPATKLGGGGVGGGGNNLLLLKSVFGYFKTKKVSMANKFVTLYNPDVQSECCIIFGWSLQYRKVTHS